MRYSAVPWTTERALHDDVVQDLLGAGLAPGCCLIFDLAADDTAYFTEHYDDEPLAHLLDEAGRPMPILVTPDGTVAVEISDNMGTVDVRMRTLLADGSLAETQRRWDEVPPWPRPLQPFRRFTTVELEMTRAQASGRSVRLSTRGPLDLLDDHRRHVADLAALRGSRPQPLVGAAALADLWNSAYRHAFAVEQRRARLARALAAVVTAALFVLVLAGVIDEAWSIFAVLLVVLVTWWSTPLAVVLMRRTRAFRTAFA